jgi:hypothetical protein
LLLQEGDVGLILFLELVGLSLIFLLLDLPGHAGLAQVVVFKVFEKGVTDLCGFEDSALFLLSKGVSYQFK